MSRTDELRMMFRVAHLYHECQLKQADISQQLHMSQAKVSRLLKRAEVEGVVRVSINVPRGTYPQLEDGLRQQYGLNEAIIAECYEDRDEPILSAIGSAAAHYIETTLGEREVIGVSSWSTSLLRTVDAIRPSKHLKAERVVQIVGGIGNPSVQTHATQMVTRLAALTGAEPQLLPARGVVSSPAAQKVMVGDTYVRAALDQFKRLTIALVGIGALRPSAIFANSGSAFSDEEIDGAARSGAVGESSLRFFDSEGKPVRGPLDDRVIGITLDELKSVRRVIGVAGGQQKVEAIRACMKGKLINVLVTDRFTAEKLL
ncbi:MAG: sugar-binding transcriptional regulator [Rhizobiaceae bacterium]|nr:sugar-binding transcriptional regulator [Rhizobiaceae bacterium]